MQVAIVGQMYKFPFKLLDGSKNTLSVEDFENESSGSGNPSWITVGATYDSNLQAPYLEGTPVAIGTLSIVIKYKRKGTGNHQAIFEFTLYVTKKIPDIRLSYKEVVDFSLAEYLPVFIYGVDTFYFDNLPDDLVFMVPSLSEDVRREVAFTGINYGVGDPSSPPYDEPTQVRHLGSFIEGSATSYLLYTFQWLLPFS